MNRLKILIVEDDEKLHPVYDAGLPDETFEKRFASDGMDALQSYHSWKPDVIVLDILLPKMTGYSLLKEIRTTLNDTSTAIIMSTSLAEKTDVMDCIALGIQGYIIKPFKVKEIGNSVMQYYQNATCT